MKKGLLLISVTALLLVLSACSRHHYHNSGPYHPNGYFCQQITRKLHADAHRHNEGIKITAIDKAKLMKRYERYGCNEQQLKLKGIYDLN